LILIEAECLMNMRIEIKSVSEGGSSFVIWAFPVALKTFTVRANLLVCCLFCLFSHTFPALASPVMVNVDTMTFIVNGDVYQPTVPPYLWSVNGGPPGPLQPPATAQYTFNGDTSALIIWPTLGGPEPTIWSAFSQAQGAAIATSGEVGLESLVFTGGQGAMAVGSSTIGVGLVGGFNALYTTVAGDSYLNVFEALLPSLTANGINASISGNALNIYDTIPDDSSLVGAVAVSWNDPGLPFAFMVTSIPEPSFTSLTMLGLGILSLLARRWPRREGAVAGSE
jgi:hypothetical protein